MSANSQYVAYYAENPHMQFAYDVQTTMGDTFRDAFFRFFPFDFSRHTELIITNTIAQDLPLFTFWNFSLWDKFLWCVNFATFCIIVWSLILLIKYIWKLIKKRFFSHSS